MYGIFNPNRRKYNIWSGTSVFFENEGYHTGPFFQAEKFYSDWGQYNPGEGHFIGKGRPLGFDSSKAIKTSNNETRPKSKFFSLLIYAGYPIL